MSNKYPPFGSQTKHNYTPIGAIREKCLDCMGYQKCEVTECENQNCSLWEYRFGERPETAVRKGRTVKRTPNNAQNPLKTAS